MCREQYGDYEYYTDVSLQRVKLMRIMKMIDHQLKKLLIVKEILLVSTSKGMYWYRTG